MGRAAGTGRGGVRAARDHGLVSEQPPSEQESHPDYRFTLANERTFLAYIRTALALDAAGLAVAQFVRHEEAAAFTLALSIVLTVLGLIISVLSYRRWNASERALRRGAPLPALRMPLLVAAGLTLASLAAVAVVVLVR